MLKNKKILLMILLVLLLIFLPNMVKAVNATEKTKTSTGIDVTWSYNVDGTSLKELKCTNISDVTGELTIPKTIDGYTVKTLGNKAFYKCYGLTKITFPSTLTSIGENAFYSCTGLQSLNIPNNITNVGERAFEECSGLKTVTLSKNMSRIPYACFWEANGIQEIVITDNITTVEWSGLDSSGLKYVYIPQNVVSIDTHAFGYNTKNLTIYGVEGSYAEEFAKNNSISFEKAENWENRKLINSAPTINKIEGTAKSNYWKNTSSGYEYLVTEGGEVSIVITFNQSIVLNQSPKLTIKFGTGSNIELTTSEASSNTLTYKYTIRKGDNGGLQIISLEGGNVTNNKGIAASLTLKALSGYKVVAKGGEGSGSTDPKPETSALKEIKIEKVANKVDYKVGEKFDKTGMVVKAIYEDGTSKQVENYTITPSTALKLSDTKVTIAYTENGVTKEAVHKIRVVNSNGNTEGGNENGDDDSIAKGTMPYTGGTFFVIITVMGIAAVAIYVYKRNNDLKGI